MTPDVPRLRRLRDDMRPLQGEVPAYNAIAELIDALLSTAPPDGAAEREAALHEAAIKAAVDAVVREDGEWRLKPDLEQIVRTAVSEYVSVHGPQPTPAPTEAPAAGDEAWYDALCRYKVNDGRPLDPAITAAFTDGWNAALAARPAAVTEAMVEAACLAQHGADAWPRLLATEPPIARAERKAAHDMLTAALAARGPA